MRKYIKWVLIVLAILVMAFIFILSSQNAVESTNESRGIGSFIGHVLFRDYDRWDPADQLAFVKKIDGSVRKAGHFVEFALLGTVLHLALSAWGVKPKTALPISLGAGVFYALTDEFHQWFVDGRAPEVTDLLLDSAGVAFGCLIVWIILTAAERKRSKKGGTESSVSET